MISKQIKILILNNLDKSIKSRCARQVVLRETILIKFCLKSNFDNDGNGQAI